MSSIAMKRVTEKMVRKTREAYTMPAILLLDLGKQVASNRNPRGRVIQTAIHLVEERIPQPGIRSGDCAGGRRLCLATSVV